eukprot:gene934-1450_t
MPPQPHMYGGVPGQPMMQYAVAQTAYIPVSAGGIGHEVDIFEFFRLVLPYYHNKLKAEIYPPELNEDTGEFEAPELDDEQKKELRDAISEWAFSFNARSSKSSILSYTSFVVSPKIEGLESEHQSSASCFTVCEIEGKDKAINLEANCRKLFKYVQILEDGESLTVVLDGKEEELTLRFDFTPTKVPGFATLGEDAILRDHYTGKKSLKLRVHKQWPMDKECPDAFLKIPHVKALSCMWLPAVDNSATVLNIWKEWWEIVKIGRDLDPSAKDRADFGPMCRGFM